ncbi:AAA family ATPase [Flavobacterium piscisymbiosum]|uniref:AAA family ATPase n=1 Tax=Flavobacterium piscisymbiosum TaxID=2893753 RepID=A0ABS8MA85_9FLAO|nr:AAA family ATPase [Flavobacterium sp. F-30]MCC9062458.1 AAA family ATPase [Flavobacterium sp. F-30]
MENKKDIVDNKDHSYFYSLELEGVNCFKDKQTLDLSDGKGNYSPWTIILGDNGTGKTTLLKVLDRMQPDSAAVDLKKLKIDSQGKIFLPQYFISGIEGTFKNMLSELKEKSISVLLKLINNGEFRKVEVSSNIDNLDSLYDERFSNSFLISYGASRRMSKSTSLKTSVSSKFTSLFDDKIELINAEEWLLQKETLSDLAEPHSKIKFKRDLELVKNLLKDVLPDVSNIGIKPVNEKNPNLLIEVQTSYGLVNLRDLSFGYQTLTALIVDIAANMMDKYLNSENPLAEPVIILIDEIDLHLHPKWQRTVVDKLSYHFPQAQFIVTAHSPLIVQSAQDKDANIVVCRKEGDRVIIDNDPESVKGWRIDQILTSDLFEVSSSKSIDFEEIRNEKTSILLKNELSDSDKKRLNFLNQKLNDTPVFSSKEAIDAEELIKKAAELLKK